MSAFWWGALVFGALYVAYDLLFMRPSYGKRQRTVDWEHVYRMEREVWGETFNHLDAPPPFVKGAPTGISTYLTRNEIRRAEGYIAKRLDEIEVAMKGHI